MDRPADMNFDEEQLAAVRHGAARLVINAGAGSGKTRVLTGRVAHLVKSGVSPSAILAVTFTRKAARELRDRIRRATGARVTVGTFHSVCYREILNAFAPALGYRRPISIYDEWLAADVLADIIVTHGRGPESLRTAEPTRVRDHLARIGRQDEQAWLAVTEAYEARLRSHNAVDYDLIIARTITLLNAHPEIRRELHRRWRHVLVDEFQDTDARQLDLISLLDPENLAVVGDDHQAIYGWRGARLENILEMAATSQVLLLRTNYRSAKAIVAAAGRLIRHNARQLPKALHASWEAREGWCASSWSSSGNCWYEAACLVMDVIHAGCAGRKFPPGEVAVLCRTNRGADEVSRHLGRIGVAHKRIVRGDFWDSDVVRRIVYSLMLIANPSDWAAWAQAANFPVPRVSAVDRAEVRHRATVGRTGPLEACMIGWGPLRDWAAEMLLMAEKFAKVGESLWTADHILEEANNRLGWMEHYRRLPGTMLAPRRLYERVMLQMRTLASRGEAGLTEFLEWYAARDAADEHEGHRVVTVCTVHAAKGLEWPVVILPGWNAGVFPSGRSDREEERRIAYVAITRAREACYIVYDGEPSPFLIEARPGPMPPLTADAPVPMGDFI